MKRALPWIVFALPGVFLTFVINVDTLTGLFLCIALGVVAGLWAHIFDGGLPW